QSRPGSDQCRVACRMSASCIQGNKFIGPQQQNAMRCSLQIVDQPHGINAEQFSYFLSANNPWEIRRFRTFVYNGPRDPEAGTGNRSNRSSSNQKFCNDLLESGKIFASDALLDQRRPKIIFPKQTQVAFRSTDITRKNHTMISSNFGPNLVDTGFLCKSTRRS